MEKDKIAIFFTAIFPAIFVVLLLFVIMPSVKNDNDDLELNNPVNKTQMEEGSQLSWEDVPDILRSGRVESVMQSHELDVVLELEGGERITLKEPGIDYIFDEIERCGRVCEDIVLSTE